jgi:hypothetical protein
MAYPQPLRAIVPAIALIVSAAPPPVSAQQVGIPHDEYFRLIGMYDQFSGLEQYLLDRLSTEKPEMPEGRRRQTATFFAYVMAANGLTAEHAVELSAEGIDFVHAITSDTRPFIEQALLTDLVVVGDALGEQPADGQDGYGSSALIRVRWILKGEAPGDTVVIRQRVQPAGHGREIRPEAGYSYLLLLSNGLYRYGAANHGARNEGWLPSEVPPQHYIIYRIYKMDDDRLDWGGFTQEDTDFAFQEIRRLDHLLSIYQSRAPQVILKR